MIGSASGTTAPSAPTSSLAGQVEQSTQRGMPVEFSVFEATTGFAECVVAVFVDHFPFDVFYGQKVRLVIHPDLFCFSNDALDAHDPAFNFVDGQADLRDIAVAPRKIIEKESKDECGEDVSHEDGGHGCPSLRLIACGMKHPISRSQSTRFYATDFQLVVLPITKVDRREERTFPTGDCELSRKVSWEVAFATVVISPAHSKETSRDSLVFKTGSTPIQQI